MLGKGSKNKEVYMSFQLNTRIAAFHPNSGPIIDVDQEHESVSLLCLKRMDIPYEKILICLTGMAVQQRVIRLQTEKFKVQSAKKMLSSAEARLYNIRRMFKDEEDESKCENCEGNTTSVSGAPPGILFNAPSRTEVFDFKIETSLNGILHCQKILDMEEEMLTSAISNSSALISRFGEYEFHSGK